MIRVALTGSAGAGKSTVAAMLEREYGFKRTRFAAPLKSMMRGLYASAGIASDEIERRIEGDLKETPDPLLSGRTPRHAMQTLGTEWRDLMDRDLWSNLWRATVPEQGGCTVEDCRFEHEYNAVKSMGFVVVAITRGGVSTMSHASERGLPAACPVDCTIENNGTLSELYAAITETLKLATVVAQKG